MPRESKTRSTAAKKKSKKPTKRGQPQVVVEGMEDVLEMDLKKHQGILEQTHTELEAYRNARAYEVRRKRHFRSLINIGKYDKAAMETAIGQSDINLRQLADKVKLFNEKIAHHEEIIVKLKEELANQHRGLKYLEEQRRDGLAD